MTTNYHFWGWIPNQQFRHQQPELMLGRLTSQVKRRLEPAQLRLNSGALVAAAALGHSQHAVWNFWI